MKAITICQPYAHLIASGEKFVENRGWYCRFRGWLAIHAGKSEDWLSPGDRERYPEMAFGAVVAVAHMEACVLAERIDWWVGRRRDAERWQWLLDHAHAEGPYCWVLGAVHPCDEPIEMPGARGLWNVPAAAVRRLRARYDRRGLIYPAAVAERARALDLSGAVAE